MQKNVSPVVAIIVIAALIAVIAFLWVRFTGPPATQVGTSPGRSATGVRGRPTGGRESPSRKPPYRRGESGGAESGATPGGGEAEPSPE